MKRGVFFLYTIAVLYARCQSCADAITVRRMKVPTITIPEIGGLISSSRRCMMAPINRTDEPIPMLTTNFLAASFSIFLAVKIMIPTMISNVPSPSCINSAMRSPSWVNNSLGNVSFAS